MHNPKFHILEGGAASALLLLALWLRWPVPEMQWTHVDERAFLLYPLGFWSGDLNPHFFNYPTFSLYLASALYYLYYLIGNEAFESFLAYHYLVDGRDLLAGARALNSLLSAATVAVVWRLGRRLYGPVGGLVAALCLACMPLHLRFAHLAITDVPAAFWTSLAALWAVRLYQEGGRRVALLGGLFAGLAAASKYPAGLALVPVAVAALARNRSWRALALPSGAALLGMGLASPYVVLDFPAFWRDFSAMGGEHLLSQSHSSGQPPWLHHLTHTLRYGLGWGMLAALAVALAWQPGRWRGEELALLAGVSAFALLLAASSSVFMRYALPLAPLLAVLVARPFPALTSRPPILGLALVLLISGPLHASLQARALLAGPDTRLQALEWMQEAMPGARRLMHLPRDAGQVPVLHPQTLYVRMDAFVERFGVERLERACRLLAEHPSLPPLYALWDFAQYEQVSAGGESAAQMLVLAYSHPLIRIGPEDAQVLDRLGGQMHWLAEFSAGTPAGAVFDPVDWYFLPIGARGSLRATGPSIRAGALPMALDAPTPQTRDFFALLSHLLAGNRAAQDRQWKRAVDEYGAILETPFFLNELFTLSYLYRMHLNLGSAYHSLGQAGRAAETWERATAIQPEQALAYYKLGHLYLELGESHKSIRALERALELRPAADAYINLGIAYGRAGQTERVREVFARALEIDPDHPRARLIRQALEQGSDQPR